MAVNLEDLIPSLERELAVAGDVSAVYPRWSDDAAIGMLQDAFWEIRLDGITAFSSYTVDDDGVVTPLSGTGDDLDRELQQLIVMYAGLRAVRTRMLSIQTLFRAKAGPMEYETQQAATLLRALLDDFKSRRNLILGRLSDSGQTDTYYIDALAARESSIDSAFTFWPGA